MVLIVGKQEDLHVRKVTQLLSDCGTDTFLLNTEAFSADCISMSSSDDRLSFTLKNETKTINTDQISSVWLRRLHAPPPPTLLEEKDAAFVRAELQHVLGSLWPLLANRRWMNTIQGRLNGERKPYQLAIAKSVGLQIPKTLITSCYKDALAFCESCNDDIIYKALNWYGFDANDRSYMIYTNRINAATLEARATDLETAPCLFQEYVPKLLELRVVVVGEVVFAVEFDSQASAYAKIDWRRYDFDNVTHKQHAIPDTLRDTIMSFMTSMGLVFGCIDLILRPDGSYVFLEVNQAGNWMWLDRLADTSISEAVAAYLANRPFIQASAKRTATDEG